MELVNPKGARIVRGLPCIYHLGLCILYSEAAREDGECYIFDPERTCCLIMGPVDAKGSQPYSCIKGFGPAIPFRPTFLKVGKTACFISDCTDPTVIAFCKRVLSGIIIAGPGDIPPEKVN